MPSVVRLTRRSNRFLLALTAATLFATGCKMSEKTPEAAKTDAAPAPAQTSQINGEDVVKLQRKATDAAKPEFLSATVIPGRGMDLMQITANIPGKGEIPILFAPSIEDAAGKLNGVLPDDLNGNASFKFGGVFLVPYPNRIRGKLSADGKTITTSWNGKPLTLPANWHGKNAGAEPHAMHGMIMATKADVVNTTTGPDGQTVTGIIHAGNFGGYWPSNTDLTITVALTGGAVDATITAKNVGTEPEPMAIGWHPYFAIPSGDRTQARLHVPGDKLALVNNYDDVFPTGQIVPVKTYEGGKYDYTAPGGKPLGNSFLDDNFSHLQRTDGKVVVDLADPAANYGVHIEGLSPEIKTVQVYAPIDGHQQFTAIEEQYNFGDPFNKKLWKGMDTGMVTLAPGKSTTWHVRLELFTPGK
ncbi:MAG TPA: aldose 1-epimerase [Acidisarcina sp.]